MNTKPLADGVYAFLTDMANLPGVEEATDWLFMKHYAGMHNEIHNVMAIWDMVKEQFENVT